jgi:iduronate 2-sulfatase
MASKKWMFSLLLCVLVIGLFIYNRTIYVPTYYDYVTGINISMNKQELKPDQETNINPDTEHIIGVNNQTLAGKRQTVLDQNYRSSQLSNETEKQGNTRKKNVIFIIVDDLRPQMSPYYGADYPYPAYQKKMFTPNLDRLAGESIVFQRAYVQIGVCGPSRISMLTSRRPDTTRVNTNLIPWREIGANFTTLPQYFKENGYVVVGSGKVFHGHKSSRKHDPLSWTEPFYSVGRVAGFHNETKEKKDYWMMVTEEERAQYPLSDDMALDIALERLRYYANGARSGEQPLFLAFGIGKPHTPIICPEKYFDLYPLEPEDLFLDNNTFIYERTDIDLENLRNYRRAYFACVTYVDELVGTLLREVDKLGLSENTIISFVSDHGLHLGENNLNGKYSLYELANHVPMMIRIPGLTDSGIQTRSIVEAVDLYPTLVEAADLGTMMSCPEGRSSTVQVCTEGISLMPLLDHPDRQVKNGAISQVQQLDQSTGDNYNVYSIRTDQYRYNAAARMIHTRQNNTKFTVSVYWNVTWIHPELYDHAVDPGENENVVDKSEYSKVIPDLQRHLQDRVHTMYDIPFDNSWR